MSHASMDGIRKGRMQSTGVYAPVTGEQQPADDPDGYWTFNGISGCDELRHQLAKGKSLSAVRNVASTAAFVSGGKVVAAGIRSFVGEISVRLHATNGAAVYVTAGEVIDLSGEHVRRASQQGNTAIMYGGKEYYGALLEQVALHYDWKLHPSRSSIGLSIMRFWAGEAALHVQAPCTATPWNDAPWIGINRAIGIVCLRPSSDGLAFEEFEPEVSTSATPRPYCVLSVHRTRLRQLGNIVPLRLRNP